MRAQLVAFAQSLLYELTDVLLNSRSAPLDTEQLGGLKAMPLAVRLM